jgi:hypothetical protein
MPDKGKRFYLQQRPNRLRLPASYTMGSDICMCNAAGAAARAKVNAGNCLELVASGRSGMLLLQCEVSKFRSVRRTQILWPSEALCTGAKTVSAPPLDELCASLWAVL